MKEYNIYYRGQLVAVVVCLHESFIEAIKGSNAELDIKPVRDLLEEWTAEQAMAKKLKGD